MREIQTLANPAELALAAARHIVTSASAAIRERGHFSLALSGGNTPHETFRALAAGVAGSIDWQRVLLFWSDERCVPPEHAESNFGAAKRLLIDQVPLVAGNIHRMQGELKPQVAAENYERTLNQALGTMGAALPRFDLILLGLGMDGHTASLFPETMTATVLSAANRGRKVLPVHVASRDSWRITMTPRLINAAREVLLLAFGKDKANIVSAVLEGPAQPTVLPAQSIDVSDGVLRWLIDAPAAVLLQSAKS